MSNGNAATDAARSCVSSDGVRLGTIVGIHRDPATNTARWAVVASPDDPRRQLFVPLQAAVPRRDGLHVPYTTADVMGEPSVADHTSMRADEEERLLVHFGLAAPTGRQPDAVPEEQLSMVRYEERLNIAGVEWRPYLRARVRRVVHTEEVTRVVTLRREELVIDEEPVTGVERLEVAFGLVEPAPRGDVEMILHREEVLIEKRVVPYERVRVGVAAVTAPWEVTDSLRRERIGVERKPVREP